MLPPSRFPDPMAADEDGLVAVTAEINVAMLLDAYRHGIFPWSEHPVRWFSPEPRAIFVPGHVRLPRRLPRLSRRQGWRVTFDQAFARVMAACARAHRDKGTWITDGFLQSYSDLHELGFAHSVEVFREEALVGGLYGVGMGAMFAGESMFHLEPNAAKFAFAHLVAHLERTGALFIDAQVLNAFTLQLGAVIVRRSDYMQLLRIALASPSSLVGGPWPNPPPPLTRLAWQRPE